MLGICRAKRDDQDPREGRYDLIPEQAFIVWTSVMPWKRQKTFTE